MKKIWNNESGFAIWEVLSAIFVLTVACVFWIDIVLGGNFWYTENGVLKEIQLQYPETTEIIHTQRNIFAYSVITVRTVREGDAAVKKYIENKYYLDSNVLFNYTLHE